MTTPNLQLAEPPDFASPIASEERDSARALDALGPGWIAVLSATTTAPPGAASQGDRYLLPLAPTGLWAGHARHIAYLTPDGWAFRAPRRGWQALVLDQGDLGRIYTYQGTDWVRLTSDAIQLQALDATQIAYAGYGLPGDPLTVDAALEEHEVRIATLELAGPGGSGAMTKLGSVTLGAPAATVTFSGISAAYSSLILTFSTNAATQFAVLYMQFNGDTAANYDAAQDFGGSAASGAVSMNAAQPEIGSMPGSSFSANQRLAGRIFIPYYSDTAGYKESTIHTGRRDAGAFYSEEYVHNWHDTSAINSITLGVSSSAFIAGSRFDLYGMQ